MTPSTTSGPGTDLRALFVHAHPDDETITTGGTIAGLMAAGVETRVLTCTLGEEGEVLGEEFAGLTADRADQLGGYRIGELRRALRALGVDRPRFLGGAGRWRDSGMVGTASAHHPRAFVGSGREAVDAVVAELEEWTPDLVVTYDPLGGYGHPDHIRAHEVVHEALGVSAHRPRRVAWTVTARSALLATHPDPPAGLRCPEEGELPSVADSRLTHRFPLDPAALSAKLQALGQHATQLRVVGAGEDTWYFALTNHVLQPVVDEEWFIAHDRAGEGYERCATGAAHLLDGLGEQR